MDKGKKSSRTSDGGGASKAKEPTFNKEDGYVRMYLRGRPITMFMPQDAVEGYKIGAKLELPAEKLSLEWAYGYRGKDCRANVELLPSGELVFFVAAVGVLQHVESGVQRHYLGHDDDIKCMAVHPDKVIVATGQVVGKSKDGKVLPAHVRVWSSASLETLHLIGGGVFDRGVLCISFSRAGGGGLLCAVDDGNEKMISVWNWKKETKVTDSKCSNEVVYSADFHPKEENVIVTCGKNNINFWALDGRNLSKKQGIFEKHEKPKHVLCLIYLDNGDAVSGDSSGNIYVWGKGGYRITRAITGVHASGVMALCERADGTFISGGRDGHVVFWDSKMEKTGESRIPKDLGTVRSLADGADGSFWVGTTENGILQGSAHGEFSPVVQGHTDELWGLAVHQNQDAFLTCAQDKQAILWNSATHRPTWIKTLKDPLQSADFHPSGKVVAIGTQAASWLVLDLKTQKELHHESAGNEQIAVMRYSPDGSHLAVGSNDNFIYVYSVSEEGHKYNAVGKCTGHSSFVTHLDWSTNGEFLMSNSGDYETLYWTPANCKQVTAMATVRDVEWATMTCVLGFSTFGVWSEGADGTDINALCRSGSGKLCVLGDDFGKVRLFRFPASQPKAPSHAYGGHCSHVTNVAFSSDDSFVFTTGGKDMGVLQWRVQ
ncbi:echinoderm microtubule-associated protein-like 2 [Petromyzon marinus]|uniref:echinoderm microtubule-associated protein-like 2 n=1 Tax=Petromyzon marinus TaxID=7757 RepID=UPI003F716547